MNIRMVSEVRDEARIGKGNAEGKVDGNGVG